MMKRRKRLRMAQRIFILVLCTMLVSGTCFNKYKIEARATTIVATLSAYTLYEICLYVGGLIIGCVGIGGLAYLIENRDDVARVGKDFIDSCDLDELSDWVISKADSLGQSYVFGSEALQQVKDTPFEVIQGGSNFPENNEDNDGDGDKDFDDRTKELEQMGMWGTTTFVNWFAERMEDLLNKDAAGEDNFLSNEFQLNDIGYSGYELNEDGYYNYSLTNTFYDSSGNFSSQATLVGNQEYFVNKCCLVYSGTSADTARYYFYYYNSDNGSLIRFTPDVNISDSNVSVQVYNYVQKRDGRAFFSTNLPVFESLGMAESFFETGLMTLASNYKPKVYRIADWLQEDWQGVIESLNTGIRSLNGNMLIVGEALNQAIANQMNGLGYISAINEGIAGSVPLSLPGTVAAPLYYPDPSAYPALDPNSYPWVQSGGSPETDPDPEPGAGSDSVEDLDIRDYAVDLRQVFPFCIPFDIMALFGVLAADPVAPRFEIPFVVPSLDIEETYVIDLSFLDEQMVLLRKLELVGFIIGLMLLTGKVIKW